MGKHEYEDHIKDFADYLREMANMLERKIERPETLLDALEISQEMTEAKISIIKKRIIEETYYD